MLRAFHRASILLCLVPFAAAARIEDQDLAAAIRQLETGDWSARMRTVHELEYMQSAGIPGLAIAAEDGDWQVRMAAVHVLGPMGSDAARILKSILKNEPCPVVRLIILHNIGSRSDDGAEEQAMALILSDSNAQVNDCRDQPAPGLLPGAAPLEHRAAKTATASVPSRPRVPAATTESHERVDTPDVPKAAVTRPASMAAPAAPTKTQRYVELDALLAEPSGTKETLGDARTIGRRPVSPPAAALSISTPARANERAALSERRTASAENLPKPVVTAAVPERAVGAPALFEAAGSKAPHDAMPDLILALKKGSVDTRSRAADELGYFGAAAVSAVPALMAAIKDKNPRVRASASLALGNIGADDKSVVPLLVAALKDKNLDVRYAATLALSRIGTPAARKAFRKRIDEDARRAIERQQP